MMHIPDKELRYFLGDNYKKLKIPKVVKILQEKGVDVNGKINLEEMFKKIEEHYAKSVGRKTKKTGP